MQEPEQPPFCLKSTLFIVILIVAMKFLAGCASQTEPVNSSVPDWDRPVWRTAVVQDLAFDYREDGDFDYVWPESVPAAVRKELETAALKVVENWHGE